MNQDQSSRAGGFVHRVCVDLGVDRRVPPSGHRRARLAAAALPVGLRRFSALAVRDRDPARCLSAIFDARRRTSRRAGMSGAAVNRPKSPPARDCLDSTSRRCAAFRVLHRSSNRFATQVVRYLHPLSLHRPRIWGVWATASPSRPQQRCASGAPAFVSGRPQRVCTRGARSSACLPGWAGCTELPYRVRHARLGPDCRYVEGERRWRPTSSCAGWRVRCAVKVSAGVRSPTSSAVPRALPARWPTAISLSVLTAMLIP
ncbi:hypothetical protein RR21198_3544 [Rhodococcus rhodochrous ATCC 21198]|nr:hypothetical protein RR21198_3544 [Rhodococcus rhodochrous ATCC 21198]